MPQFLIYEGVSEDPTRQTMRLVDGERLEDVWAAHPHALCVSEYVEPRLQDPPDLVKLRRGMPAWSN